MTNARKTAGCLHAIHVEYLKATDKFPSFNSCHEGYAVILEELDELWEEIKRNPKDREAIRSEAIQVGAMALRFLVDVTADDSWGE